jgi:hypothetical protein
LKSKPGQTYLKTYLKNDSSLSALIQCLKDGKDHPANAATIRFGESDIMNA